LESVNITGKNEQMGFDWGI